MEGMRKIVAILLISAAFAVLLPVRTLASQPITPIPSLVEGWKFYDGLNEGSSLGATPYLVLTDQENIQHKFNYLASFAPKDSPNDRYKIFGYRLGIDPNDHTKNNGRGEGIYIVAQEELNPAFPDRWGIVSYFARGIHSDNGNDEVEREQIGMINRSESTEWTWFKVESGIFVIPIQNTQDTNLLRDDLKNHTALDQPPAKPITYYGQELTKGDENFLNYAVPKSIGANVISTEPTAPTPSGLQACEDHFVPPLSSDKAALREVVITLRDEMLDQWGEVPGGREKLQTIISKIIPEGDVPSDKTLDKLLPPSEDMKFYHLFYQSEKGYNAKQRYPDIRLNRELQQEITEFINIISAEMPNWNNEQFYNMGTESVSIVGSLSMGYLSSVVTKQGSQLVVEKIGLRALADKAVEKLVFSSGRIGPRLASVGTKVGGKLTALAPILVGLEVYSLTRLATKDTVISMMNNTSDADMEKAFKTIIKTSAAIYYINENNRYKQCLKDEKDDYGKPNDNLVNTILQSFKSATQSTYTANDDGSGCSAFSNEDNSISARISRIIPSIKESLCYMIFSIHSFARGLATGAIDELMAVIGSVGK